MRRGIAAIDATWRDGNGIAADCPIWALGEKDRMQGKGITAAQSRAQLLAARQNRK
jgi:hypothetical protein